MPVVYFDSSALVKLVVREEGRELAVNLWDGADATVTSTIAHPEVRSALAAAHRDDRLSGKALERARRLWQGYWDLARLVVVDRVLAERAGSLAAEHRLRGADAVHLASVLALSEPSVVVATWDQRLRVAVGAVGLSLAP